MYMCKTNNHRLLEMHNKSIMAAVSAFCSIGGWFLWNLVFSKIYGRSPIYHVRDGFMHRFGRNPLWWLTLLAVLIICILFEIIVTVARVAISPTDVGAPFPASQSSQLQPAPC